MGRRTRSWEPSSRRTALRAARDFLPRRRATRSYRPCEEEGRQERERDDTHPFLLLAMLLVVAAHDEAENERRQYGVSIRRVCEHHQHEERDEDELDLRLDHAIPVAPKEPGCEPRQNQDQEH